MKKILSVFVLIAVLSSVCGQKVITVNFEMTNNPIIDKKTKTEWRDTAVERITTTYQWQDTTLRPSYSYRDTLIKTSVKRVVRYIDENSYVRTKVYLADGTSRSCDADNGERWFKVGQYVEYTKELVDTVYDTVVSAVGYRIVTQQDHRKYYRVAYMKRLVECSLYDIPSIPAHAKVTVKIDTVNTFNKVKITQYDTTDLFTYSKSDLVVVYVEKYGMYSSYEWSNTKYRMRVYSEYDNKYYTVSVNKALYDKYKATFDFSKFASRKESVSMGVRLDYEDLYNVNSSYNYTIAIKTKKAA